MTYLAIQLIHLFNVSFQGADLLLEASIGLHYQSSVVSILCWLYSQMLFTFTVAYIM